MKKRQYRSNQGRKPKQVAETQKVITVAFIGLLGVTVYLILI